MLELHPLFKSLHIIGFVSWFAGMFYLVRMFVYHTEALKKDEPEKSILTKQIGLMETRVYKIICNPAMNITWIFGLLMIYNLGMDWLKDNHWLHIKLGLLAVLTLYHVYNKKIIYNLSQGRTNMTPFQFRLYNEVPTLFLVSIVLLAVYRNQINLVYTAVGMVVFGLVMYLIAKLYKKKREA